VHCSWLRQGKGERSADQGRNQTSVSKQQPQQNSKVLALKVLPFAQVTIA